MTIALTKARRLNIDNRLLTLLYVDKKFPLIKTAKYFDCGITSVVRYLDRLGIKRRKPSDYKHSKETKLKISKSKIGKKSNSPTIFKKNDIRLMGANNPAWKGGITPKNKLIRTSTIADDWRKLVLSRDNWTCQACKKRGGDLEVHHIKSFKEYPELRFIVNNGITYCKKCHSKNDKNRRIK